MACALLSAFRGARSFKGDLSSWDVSGVVDFRESKYLDLFGCKQVAVLCSRSCAKQVQGG